MVSGIHNPLKAAKPFKNFSLVILITFLHFAPHEIQNGVLEEHVLYMTHFNEHH